MNVLDNVIFPNSVIVAGVTGTRSRQNTRTRNQGGYVDVSVVRDYTLRSWQIGTAPLRIPAFEQLVAVAEVTDYGAFGMLLEDPIDNTATVANGALTGYMLDVETGPVGYGNGCPTYGFRKLYTIAGGARTKAHALTRTRNAVVYRGGVAVTVGSSAGNIAISSGVQYVTFVPDATRTVSSVTVGATTQVTLSSGIGLSVGHRLWLQGLTGADAALLNGQSHEITNVSTATYTLAVNTSGKTITAAGQGHKYPQPDETLTWAGKFYFPVHFRDDNLEWELVVPGQYDARHVTIPQTYLDEVREA